MSGPAPAAVRRWYRWLVPASTPAPTYSLKFGVSPRSTRPSPAISCWVRSMSAGRRAPNEKNTCWPPPGAERGHRPGQEQLSPGHRVRRVGAGHVEGPRQGRGQRLPQVVPDQLDRSRPVPAVCAAMQASTSGSVSTTVSRRTRSARLPRQPVGEAGDGHRDQVVVAEQQDPRARPAHRPRAAPAPGRSWWPRCSASGRAPAWPRARPPPPRSARRSAGGRPPGWKRPGRRTPGSGQSARAGRRRRPRGRASVSRTGRDRSTTPRLRSSLQIAVTIGTGSSASWLTARTATGSVRLIARITSLTPAGPSASPVAAATSARTASAVLAMVMVPGSQQIRCARTRVARP